MKGSLNYFFMGNLPIGIFDSGIGGLTLAHAIRKKLPNENIIYFGDTKHLPYGEKSSKAIQEFSRKIVAVFYSNSNKQMLFSEIIFRLNFVIF